jgi:pyridoxal phosphate enzyme (YggS family)
VSGERAVSLASNLEEVHRRIERAAEASGRDPAEVRLVAVSKTRSPDVVREAYAAGLRDFGENYAQELAAKADALRDLPGIRWHFIGHLQTNKAKIAAKHAHVVHTIDSVALVRELGRRASRENRPDALPLRVLIEVNIGGAAQKAGATPSEIAEVMGAIAEERSLALHGLMTVPPVDDAAAARRVFATLASLRGLHGGAAALPELSMGMSADLEIAIAQGATMVRIGTALFGPRA